MNKVCAQCGKEFDSRGREKTCGLDCKRARKQAYLKKYRLVNKDKLCEAAKQWYRDNKELALADSRKRYAENKQHERLRSKKYYAKNKGKAQAQRRQYYIENKEKVAACLKKCNDKRAAAKDFFRTLAMGGIVNE